MYSYLRFTDRVLDVFFLLIVVTSSELHENINRNIIGSTSFVCCFRNKSTVDELFEAYISLLVDEDEDI